MATVGGCVAGRRTGATADRVPGTERVIAALAGTRGAHRAARIRCPRPGGQPEGSDARPGDGHRAAVSERTLAAVVLLGPSEQVRASLGGHGQGLGVPPPIDRPVITRGEDLGDPEPTDHGRPRVLRVLQQA